MIKPLKFRNDFNFYLFFDVETSPTYFNQQKNKLVEESKIISKTEYLKLKRDNENLGKIIHQVGLYHITKMITIVDMDNNAYALIVDDEYLKSNLEKVKNKYFEATLLFGDTSEEIIEMFWEIIDRYMEEHLNVRCFAHNIGFDVKQIDFFTQLKSICGKGGKKVTSASLSKPFFIKVKYDEESTLSFDDSYSFFTSSLKNLGRDIGIEKMEQNFEGENLIIDDNCIEYGLMDAYIIKEAICRLINYLKEKELGVLGITIAGTAMNIWRTSFLDYPINNDYPEEIRKIERKIYYGGRNECYKIGMFLNIYYFDINSLYPYVMEKFKFPTMYLKTINNKYEKFTKKYIKELLSNDENYYIFKCKINTEKNHIPLRDSRLMFIKGEYNGYMHLAEFTYFFERGEVEEVEEVIVYKKDYIFKDYIAFFKKEKYKNDNNPSYRLNAKNFQNNLYGKFAELLRESEIFEEEEAKIMSVLEITEEGNNLRRDYFGYFGIQNILHEDENAKTAFPAIAGAITSYTRTELLKMIDKLGMDNLLYDDTDSLMSKVPIPKEFIHDFQYGKWKNEAHKLYKKNNLPVKDTLDVIIKGCKNYLIFDKESNKILSIKSKGIKKDSKEISDDFYSTNKWWTVKTTKVKKESMFTLKHTVIMHELKKNSLQYLKGKTIFLGEKKIKIDGITIKYNVRDIKPWRLSDLKKLEKEI